MEVNVNSAQNDWVWYVGIDASNGYGLLRRSVGDLTFRKIVAGVQTDAPMTPTLAPVGSYKVAVSVGPLGMLISQNGVAGTSASYAVPVASGGTLYFGNGSVGSNLLPTDKNFRVWQKQLTQAELNLLTA